ncbi:MAG TPA: cellulase family glycosylhydrolase [Phycisphaerales bacterium]|nr:cellulase family glycosylhydrolase [Phycisphaerales bacterium]
MLAPTLALFIACAQPTVKPPAKPVPKHPNAALVNRLRRGINLSHWWWKPPSPEEGRIERLISPDDVALLKSAGVSHVRIPVDPALITDEPKRFNQHRMMEFTRAVHTIQSAGIATVIDVHTSGTPTTTLNIDRNPENWERDLTAFWTAFAPCWKNSPPEFLAVELFNEPNGANDDKEWPQAQERLRAVVRKALPRHTIVLTGDDWGSIDGLVRLTPSADANVVYSFHFYEPHTFTHQQATWGSPMWKEIKGLLYPLDQKNADAVLAAAADPKAANSVRWYAKDQWDAKKIQSRFDKAKAWADEHKATLYLGEFGAYRAGCDQTSRCAWLKDVRSAAEKSGIGWCAWDYAGGFGLTDKPAPTSPRRLDPASAAALGLSVPPRRR